MKPKRSLASVVLELAAVLLVTALTFTWGYRPPSPSVAIPPSVVSTCSCSYPSCTTPASGRSWTGPQRSVACGRRAMYERSEATPHHG